MKKIIKMCLIICLLYSNISILMATNEHKIVFNKFIENRNGKHYAISNDAGNTWSITPINTNTVTNLLNSQNNIFRNFIENRNGVYWASYDYGETWERLRIAKSPNKLEINNIFPNPTNKKFNLEIFTKKSNKQINFYLYSLDGNILFEKNEFILTNEHTYEFDISEFPKGMYILTIQSQDILKTKLLKVE